MFKFHISPDGNPRVCAAAGRCPLGGEENHTDAESLADARVWSEKVLEERYAQQSQTPLKKVRRAEASAPVKARYDSSNPIEPNRLMSAAAQAGIPGWRYENGKLVSEKLYSDRSFGGKQLPLVMEMRTKGSVAYMRMRFQGKRIDQWTGRMSAETEAGAIEKLQEFMASKESYNRGVALGSAFDWEGEAS